MAGTRAGAGARVRTAIDWHLQSEQGLAHGFVCRAGGRRTSFRSKAARRSCRGIAKHLEQQEMQETCDMAGLEAHTLCCASSASMHMLVLFC